MLITDPDDGLGGARGLRTLFLFLLALGLILYLALVGWPIGHPVED